MPIDHETIIGETNIDRLTTILADENQDFFIDTYSFYLVALVLSGKSIFYGRGRFANIFFVKSRDYAFPVAPSENAPEEEKKKYRHEAGKKLDRIKSILYSDRVKEYDSDEFDFDESDTNSHGADLQAKSKLGTIPFMDAFIVGNFCLAPLLDNRKNRTQS